MSLDSTPNFSGVSEMHESAHQHVSGEARYVDDWPLPHGSLVAQIVPSRIAHGRLKDIDVRAARAVAGVTAVLTARDIPGENNVGPVVHDEELLASDVIYFQGQALALVVGESLEACRAGVAAVTCEVDQFPAILTIAEAAAAENFLTDVHRIARGDVDAAMKSAPLRFHGTVQTGAQDHFYLETQCSVAFAEESSVRLISSTQHPSEVQTIVARILGRPRNQVVVEAPRLGGGFGGKETQAANYAALAALAAVKTNKTVKVWLNRDQDMCFTGKRHAFHTEFEVAHDAQGALLALRAHLVSDGGFSTDLSRAILDRALFHVDNAYFIPHVELTGRVAKTNLPSNTAFRGFGGPQGMAVIEEIMSRIAERLDIDASAVRERNFYGSSPGDITPYGQHVRDHRLPRIWSELKASSNYELRLSEIAAFNQNSPSKKRGLAITPVKFGISFTTSFLNQAGAMVLIYADGSVQVNHGGVEMGQGLHSKMLAVAASELGLPQSRIRMMTTATDKVPNTSATAASSGSDLNGQAVKQACEVLKARLLPVAARVLGVDVGAIDDLQFAGGSVFLKTEPNRSVAFEKVAAEAYLAQVSMSATGFYRTPGISYDRTTGQGSPFYYYAYGAAVSEVELCGYTGRFELRRVDILHDVGSSMIRTIDVGQIEGAFIQGVGWLTCEEVLFDETGRLLTHSPDTYKIPTVGCRPGDFRVAHLSDAPQDGVIHGSKAVGEPPLMLALSVVAALRHAVAAFGPKVRSVDLKMPCTPESLLWAIEAQKAAV